ncbi:MAG: hypothetical protein QNJ45_26940 [Ardenticatenaceae bacterium]|nr:hypothetical protein [Ardenticatenaceae bacterium]
MKLLKKIYFLFFVFVLVLTGFINTQPAVAGTIDPRSKAAYQSFERGMMVWREDTGEIYVLFDDGRVMWFAESSYNDLPRNPVIDIPPDGLIKPDYGFGRVWGHNDLVRIGLGWATSTEVAYTLTVSSEPYTAGGLYQFSITLPDGQKVLIHEDNTWRYPGARQIPNLPAVSSFPASIQHFENGMMLYWSETGTIWVLEDSGRAHIFLSEDYGALPDNPIRQKAPAGLIKPIFGFGKVWGHFSYVRQELGWAVSTERSYHLSFERAVALHGPAVYFIVSLPDGRRIRLRDDQTWSTIN